MDKYLLKTNLSRAIIMGLIAVMAMIAFYLIDRSIVTLLILIVLILIFVQYLLSYKLFRITVNNQCIEFEYLKLYKRKCRCLIEDLYVKHNTEVHFRGGRNEILEIFNKESNKKLFEINKRLFKSETDYKSFTKLFIQTQE